MIRTSCVQKQVAPVKWWHQKEISIIHSILLRQGFLSWIYEENERWVEFCVVSWHRASVRTFSVKYDQTLANHDIRHQAIRKVCCQPGDGFKAWEIFIKRILNLVPQIFLRLQSRAQISFSESSIWWPYCPHENPFFSLWFVTIFNLPCHTHAHNVCDHGPMSGDLWANFTHSLFSLQILPTVELHEIQCFQVYHFQAQILVFTTLDFNAWIP